MMMMMTTLIVALVLGSHAVTAATFGCNICGGVNFTFLNSLGVVTFDYGEENKQEKRPCQQLQQEVEDPTIYNRTFCLTHIPTAAMEPCRCVNTEGELLTDLGAYPYNNEFCSTTYRKTFLILKHSHIYRGPLW
jgi:hypothetical protein